MAKNTGEAALDRELIRGIGNRADRLKKLIGLGAPSIIIFNEVEKLRRVAVLLGGGKYLADSLAQEAVASFNGRKPDFGICATPGCFEECFEECDFDGLERCAGCQERLTEQRRREDEEMDRAAEGYDHS